MSKSTAIKQENPEATIIQFKLRYQDIVNIVSQLPKQQQLRLFEVLKNILAKEEGPVPGVIRLTEDQSSPGIRVVNLDELDSFVKTYKSQFSMDDLAGSVLNDISEEEYQRLVKSAEEQG